MDKSDFEWFRMNQGPIKLPLFDYLENLFEVEFNNGRTVKVAVGTDSQRKNKGYKFATVIVVTTFEDLGGGVTVGRGAMVIGANYHSNMYKKK